MTKFGRGDSRRKRGTSRGTGRDRTAGPNPHPFAPGDLPPGAFPLQPVDAPPGEFLPAVDPFALKKEKAKARELRDSAWWKRKRGSGRCYYCGNAFAPAELTMDHVIPLVRGGRSVKENLVPSCKDCNNKKKYLLPTEWQEYLDSLR